ncbi:MAG: LacI family transcriptional regulator [Thermomicrobia bacterium]|nr:LacI family transcriptional regulator [Thermomicrobia bacterium]MCA1723201.1 LacI family transcriptional regulator [Thermomicrobia bacterium]
MCDARSEGKRRVRQREIAARAGVSVSTVSRVLGGVVGISTPVRQHVLAIADALGYAEGRTRLNGGVRHFGFFVGPSRGDFHDRPHTTDFYADILAGVEMECRNAGVHLSYTVVEPGYQSSLFVLDKAKQSRMDGVLLLAVDDRAVIETILMAGVPAVLINAEQPELPMDTFVPDNQTGARLAVRHLLARGHCRILHLTARHRPTIRQRFDAYRATLAEAGIADDPALILQTTIAATPAYEAMHARLRAGRPDFSAVFCANDLTAIGAMRALRENGLRIPADISVIGFDDIPMAAHTDPPLTTVRIEREELGALAVRRLLHRVATPALTPIHVALACRLIERQTVASR